jgi:hypothetical protein
VLIETADDGAVEASLTAYSATPYPSWLEIAAVAAFALVFFVLAIRGLSRAE